MELAMFVGLIYALVILFYWIPLVRSKAKKEAWISFALIGGSFVVLVLYLLNIYVYSPSRLIEWVIYSIFPYLEKGG